MRCRRTRTPRGRGRSTCPGAAGGRARSRRRCSRARRPAARRGVPGKRFGPCKGSPASNPRSAGPSSVTEVDAFLHVGLARGELAADGEPPSPGLSAVVHRDRRLLVVVAGRRTRRASSSSRGRARSGRRGRPRRRTPCRGRRRRSPPPPARPRPAGATAQQRRDVDDREAVHPKSVPHGRKRKRRATWFDGGRMDDPTQPFAVPPGAPAEPERQQPPLPPRPQPPSTPARRAPTTEPVTAQQPPYWGRRAGDAPARSALRSAVHAASSHLPPIASGSWPSLPPLLPAESPPRPPFAGGRGHREPGDPRRGALLIAAIGAAAIVIVGVLAWGQSTRRLEQALHRRCTDDDRSDRDGFRQRRDRQLAARSSGNSNSSSSSDTEPDLQTAVLDIKAFVERQRGLKFKTKRRRATGRRRRDAPRCSTQEFAKERSCTSLESQEVLRALGSIPPTFDLTAAEREPAGQQRARLLRPRDEEAGGAGHGGHAVRPRDVGARVDACARRPVVRPRPSPARHRG